MSEFYQIMSCEEGHYRITGKDMVFMDLLMGSEKALLWDTGYGYGQLEHLVRELIGERPLYLINSHGHVDHTCGNYQFTETIYIHEKDAALCREHTGEKQRENALENAQHNFNFMTGKVENILPEDLDREAYVHGSCGNLKYTKEGDCYELGGITLRICEFPGHTAGCLGLYWEEEKLLFSGDSFSPFTWIFMPEALKLADYIGTLKKAWAMDFTHFYMAHNPDRTEKKELLNYIKAAEMADFEKGFPFETNLAPGIEARVCALPGYGPQDFDKPGFAAVVLSREHL